MEITSPCSCRKDAIASGVEPSHEGLIGEGNFTAVFAVCRANEDQARIEIRGPQVDRDRARRRDLERPHIDVTSEIAIPGANRAGDRFAAAHCAHNAVRLAEEGNLRRTLSGESEQSQKQATQHSIRRHNSCPFLKMKKRLLGGDVPTKTGLDGGLHITIPFQIGGREPHAQYSFTG